MKKLILLILILSVKLNLDAQPSSIPASGYTWVLTQSSVIYQAGPASTSPDFNSGNTNFGLSGDSDPADCSAFCGGDCDGVGTISDKLFGVNNIDIPLSATCEQRALILQHWTNNFPNSNVSDGATSGTVYIPNQGKVEIIQAFGAPGTGAGGTNNRAWIIGGNGPGNTSRFNCKVEYDISWQIDEYGLSGTSGLQEYLGSFEGEEPGGSDFNQLPNWAPDFGNSFGNIYTISPSQVEQDGGSFEVVFISTSSVTVTSRVFGNGDGMIAHDPGMEGRATYTVLYDVWEIQEILPVKLTFFDVKTNNKINILSWETATEQNNKGFIIEKSDNGEDWTMIGFVEGNGSSNASLRYSFSDNNHNLTTVYYRLKQVDFDGKSSYSPIRSVFKESNHQINVYPNPASDLLTIEGIATGTLEVFSVNGDLLSREDIRNQKHILNIQNLPAGMYLLRTIADGDATLKRIIKR